ncbi:signal peptidase II [Pontibacillus litoralis]|uniref:signal peptidase II n=1 Tax=Pontibacillus litoralis TaxID=516703 RepID=UPI0018DC494D|nr:signal peptidase II [Pontibacillus litoralis]
MVWYYMIAVVVVIIDQITKWIVVQTMEIGEQIPIIEPFLYLTSHRNTGAAWGILEGRMMFFYIITTIVIIGIVYYMQTYAKNSKLLGVSLALLLGGAIGNFIDRLFRKEVVDFVDTYIGSYNYPIFNVADAALVVGVALVFIATLMDERKVRKEAKYK